MSVEELVKRLRGWKTPQGKTWPFAREAADKLEELAAENDRLNLDSLKVGDQMLAEKFRADKAEAALAEAKRENEALRDAGLKLMPYLRWTIGPESLGHHPTMPSAVNAFIAALEARTAGGNDAE